MLRKLLDKIEWAVYFNVAICLLYKIFIYSDVYRKRFRGYCIIVEFCNTILKRLIIINNLSDFFSFFYFLCLSVLVEWMYCCTMSRHLSLLNIMLMYYMPNIIYYYNIRYLELQQQKKFFQTFLKYILIINIQIL